MTRGPNRRVTRISEAEAERRRQVDAIVAWADEEASACVIRSTSLTRGGAGTSPPAPETHLAQHAAASGRLTRYRSAADKGGQTSLRSGEERLS